MREEWRAGDGALDAIAAARQSDPFAVLGPHLTAAGWAIRAFAPDAISVRALTRDGKPLADLPRRKDDFFEALIPTAKERPAYRLEVETAQGTYSYLDAYAFGPALGPLDDYLLLEGTHRQLYSRLGAQLINHEGVAGVLFAVWAPNASRASRSSATSISGTAGAARCASASTAACGRSSSPIWPPARSTNTRFSAPTARCCR